MTYPSIPMHIFEINNWNQELFYDGTMYVLALLSVLILCHHVSLILYIMYQTLVLHVLHCIVIKCHVSCIIE